MRRARLPILVASLLLVSRASLGAARIPDLEGNGESSGLSLRLRLLPWGEGRAPRGPLLAPSWPAAPGQDNGTPAVGLPSLVPAGPGEELRRRLTELSERLKRQERPLSIDLTFHLLRHMLEISRAQSQQEQAEQNRLLFDALGK